MRALRRALSGLVPVNRARQRLCRLVPEETHLDTGVKVNEIVANAAGVGPTRVFVRPGTVL